MGILNKLVVYAQPMFGICSDCKTNSFCSVVYKYNIQFQCELFQCFCFGKVENNGQKGLMNACVPDVPVLWICNVLYLSASPSVSPDLLFYLHFCKIMAFIKILTVKVSLGFTRLSSDTFIQFEIQDNFRMVSPLLMTVLYSPAK